MNLFKWTESKELQTARLVLEKRLLISKNETDFQIENVRRSQECDSTLYPFREQREGWKGGWKRDEWKQSLKVWIMHEEPRPDEKQSSDQNPIADPVTTEPSLKPWSLPLSPISVLIKHTHITQRKWGELILYWYVTAHKNENYLKWL